MEHSVTRDRKNLKQRALHWPPVYPPAYTEMAPEYFSVNGNSGLDQSESNGASETMSGSAWSKDSLPYLKAQSIRSDAMSESGWSKDSPPNLEAQSTRSDAMSDSGWSRDSPPNFSKQSNRKDDTGMTSSVHVAVVATIVVAAMLYFACNLFFQRDVGNSQSENCAAKRFRRREERYSTR